LNRIPVFGKNHYATNTFAVVYAEINDYQPTLPIEQVEKWSGYAKFMRSTKANRNNFSRH